MNKLSSDTRFLIGLSIMIGSIFVLCSATAFHSWIALIPALGSLPIFFLGLLVSIDGADSLPTQSQLRPQEENHD
jgi:hypothetical protein